MGALVSGLEYVLRTIFKSSVDNRVLVSEPIRHGNGSIEGWHVSHVCATLPQSGDYFLII